MPARAWIYEHCLAIHREVATLVHPMAAVSELAELQPGVVVMAQAVVHPDAVVGRGAIVNTGAIVEHDCRVGAFARVSPGSVMGGAATLGEGAELGMGASLLPLVHVGAHSIVGAGAAVVRNIPGNVVAVGVPARVVREL